MHERERERDEVEDGESASQSSSRLHKTRARDNTGYIRVFLLIGIRIVSLTFGVERGADGAGVRRARVARVRRGEQRRRRPVARAARARRAGALALRRALRFLRAGRAGGPRAPAARGHGAPAQPVARARLQGVGARCVCVACCLRLLRLPPSVCVLELLSAALLFPLPRVRSCSKLQSSRFFIQVLVLSSVITFYVFTIF